MSVTITPYVDITSIMASVSNLILIGTILPYPSATIPDSWHACDGSKLLKADYPELYSVLGSTFGAETATEFYLPDLRGRTVIGTSSSHALASSGGVESQTLTVAQLPSHTHSVSGTLASSGKHTHNYDRYSFSDSGSGWASNSSRGSYSSTATTSSGEHTHDLTLSLGNTGSGDSITNMQPFSTLNYIIKVK